MNLLQRVQDILLKPQATWPVIEQEPADVAAIYQKYLVFLAAIPAVAGFVGLSLIGIGGFGLNLRVPLVSGLVHMVVSYVLSLVLVFVFALVVDALAPTFGGTRNRIAAVKLVAYAMTASFVGGVFALVPSLSVLGLLASVYSIYLLYLGVPVLMKCPPDKAAAYTAVAVVCGIVLGLVVGALSAMTLPSSGFGNFGGASRDRSDVVLSTPDGEVKIDTSKMDEMARKMEEAGKRMEAAQKSGDSAAAGKAMGDIMGAMTGAGGEPIAPQDLKAALPESLGDLRRSGVEAQSSQAMGMAASSAKAAYRGTDQQVDLTVTDVGGTAGLAALGWAAAITLDRDTDGKVERVYKQGARTVREEFQKDGSRGEYTLILANGLIVEAKGERLPQPALKAFVEGLDLAKLESLKRAAKS
jgi:hypothetical protein